MLNLGKVFLCIVSFILVNQPAERPPVIQIEGRVTAEEARGYTEDARKKDKYQIINQTFDDMPVIYKAIKNSCNKGQSDLTFYEPNWNFEHYRTAQAILEADKFKCLIDIYGNGLRIEW